MNSPRQRPLSVGPLRAFEAVARRLSFRAAAEELFLTQSAISRQIQSLEEEVGAVLFLRGTRHVELTAEGSLLSARGGPGAESARCRACARSARAGGAGSSASTTFASFSSLWLIPKLEAYQRINPDLDIRVSASDTLVDLDDSDIDIALRYCGAERIGQGAERLFGELLTPAVSPWLAQQATSGTGPPLASVADLAHHALAEEDDHRPSGEYLSWRHWLAVFGEPGTAATPLDVPELHLPAGAGRTRRPGGHAGAGAAGGRVAGPR